VDLLRYEWPVAAFDAVVAIFIQFTRPADRDRMFEGMKGALRPGGWFLLQGYRPEQIDYGTGGPPWPENLYTEDLLRGYFADFQILSLEAYDAGFVPLRLGGDYGQGRRAVRAGVAIFVNKV
jgi:hypothetical protein